MSDNLANPAPLGLMGFGMTTVLLNIHNAGLFEMSAVILAMGIFYGGIAQIIAGCMEFKKGNTFGTTAFTSYGLFWLTLVFIIYFNGKFGMPANTMGFMACYLFMWGLFTFFMWIGTWKANRGLQVVFLSLTILFWMLAATRRVRLDRNMGGSDRMGRHLLWIFGHLLRHGPGPQ